MRPTRIRDFEMKKTILGAMVIVFTLPFMISCDPIYESVVEDKKELYVIKLNPETDHFDFLVAGTDSVNAVVNMNWQTNTPQKAYLFFNDEAENGLLINFREGGLPDNAVYNDVVIFYDNFRGTKCDITVIKPNGESQFLSDIECKLDWDKLIENQNTTKSVNQTSVKTRSQNEEIFIAISHSIKFISNATSAALCGAGIVGFFTGIGTLPSIGLLAYGCGSALVGVLNDYFLPESNLYIGLSASATGATATLVGCARGVSTCVRDVLGRMVIPTAMGMSIAEKAKANNVQLRGTWYRGDIAVTFAGTGAFFSQINSGHWLSALNNGKISRNSLKFGNITRTGDLTWSCQQLWHYWNYGTGGEIINSRTEWVSGTITANAAGNHIVTTSSVGESHSYTKISQ